MNRRALSWNQLFNLFRSHPEGDDPVSMNVGAKAPPGNYKTLPDTMRAMGNAIWKDAYERHSGLVLDRIAKEARDADLPLNYVLWVFFEVQKSWPTLTPAERRGLRVMRNLVTEDGAMPNYYTGLGIPTEVGDRRMDGVIKGLAAWAQTDLRARLTKEYIRTSNKYVHVAANRLGIWNWDMTYPGEKADLVREAFEMKLSKNPETLVTSGLHVYSMIALVRGWPAK
jgi:hypothetical protein